MTLLRLFFSFRGRLTRAGYWTVNLTWSAAGAAFIYAWDALDAKLGSSHLAAVALGLMIVPMAISGVAIGTRRLHDRGKSGWWLLLFYLCPLLLEAIAELRALEMESAAVVILNVVWRGIALWAFVALGCVPGNTGPNRYGSDPLAVPAFQSP